MPSLFSILACLGRRFCLCRCHVSILGFWQTGDVIAYSAFQFSLPREERFALHRRTLPLSDFNSRSLLGERFVLGFLTGLTAIISILAPCVGSDQEPMPAGSARYCFNSRSPPGERYKAACLKVLILNFNSCPCVRSDFFECFPIHTADKFQFSFPVWGAMGIVVFTS